MIAFVQAIVFTANANHTTSAPITNGAGNLMFLIVDASDSGATPPTVADTQGNIWTQIRHDANSGNTSVSIWYAANIAGGTNTITVTNFSSSVYCLATMAEYSGVALTSPVDQQSECGVGSSTTITTGVANALVIFASSVPSSGPPPTYGAGWNGRIVTGVALIEDKVPVVLGTTESTIGAEATFTSAGQLFYLVSFKPAVVAVSNSVVIIMT